jgi:hypothetical protein
MLVHKPGASLARFVNVLWLSQGYGSSPDFGRIPWLAKGL